LLLQKSLLGQTSEQLPLLSKTEFQNPVLSSFYICIAIVLDHSQQNLISRAAKYTFLFLSKKTPDNNNDSVEGFVYLSNIFFLILMREMSFCFGLHGRLSTESMGGRAPLLYYEYLTFSLSFQPFL